MDECSTNIALTTRHARAPKGQRAHGSAPRNRDKNVTLISSVSLGGVGPSLSIERPADGESFGPYVRELPRPALRSGRIVVMGNLSVRKRESVGEAVEGRG